jgi:carboxypeptidase family protein
MRRFVHGLGVFAFLLLDIVCSAQTAGTAAITGRIQDQSGAIISDVSLVLRNTATGFTYVTRSSGTGDFTFEFLPIGSYILNADAKGFRSVAVRPIQLSLNQRLNLPLTLDLGTTDTEITVVTEINSIDTSSAALRTVFTEKEMQDLPSIPGIYVVDRCNSISCRLSWGQATTIPSRMVLGRDHRLRNCRSMGRQWGESDTRSTASITLATASMEVVQSAVGRVRMPSANSLFSRTTSPLKREVWPPRFLLRPNPALIVFMGNSDCCMSALT